MVADAELAPDVGDHHRVLLARGGSRPGRLLPVEDLERLKERVDGLPVLPAVAEPHLRSELKKRIEAPRNFEIANPNPNP